jgi:uncharacterized protein YhfF
VRALPEPDRAAAAVMWSAYLAAHPDVAILAPEYEVEFYGDSRELADELLALVIAGGKRATAGLVDDFRLEGQLLPRVGGHWIACDGSGAPRVIQRSIELRLGVLESVDDAFAWDEGEDDRTRADWLAGHRRYFTRTLAARGDEFDEAQLVVFERFIVVWPPELAD